MRLKWINFYVKYFCKIPLLAMSISILAYVVSDTLNVLFKNEQGNENPVLVWAV